MNYLRLLALSILALAASALPAGAARASSVIYSDANFVQGQQSFVQSFNISTPGTLTITLSNIPWLDAVSDLSGFLTTTSGVIGQEFNGSESVSVGAGTVYAHWFGDAQGAGDIGVVGINVVFQPSNVTAVPIPASIILLLSGLIIAFIPQRRSAAAASAGVWA